MTTIRSTLSASLRWGWFGLLVLLAFGYLVAGLSHPPKKRTSARSVSLGDERRFEDHSIAEAIQRIDKVWLQSLAEDESEPAPMADWMAVGRRISLALVGSGMSLEEIRALEQLPESQRETAHLENLLRDSRYHRYWAERWARYLVGTDSGQFIVYRRRRFRIWLSDVFAANDPYDKMVRRLITAEGLWTDKPEVNFLTATFDSNNNQPDPVRLAARTSRVFLGLRIDCLQCHNDFLGNVNLGDVDSPREGRQTDFHQLAAFFTSAKGNGLLGVRDGKVDYKYKYLDASEEVSVEPAVPYSPELLPASGDARTRLAAWVTHPDNRQAARAAVSHVWALMYGQPVGEAVDNLPLDTKSHPIVETLTDDFVQHGFDMRRLIRLIAGSAAFRVDSRGPLEVTQKHERAFAVFPLVRLRPEQVAGCVIQAARVKRVDRDSAFFIQFQAMTGINDFVTRYGDIGEDEFTTDSVTISQRLLMMNGKLLREYVKANPVLNTTAHARMFAANDSAVVDTAYLCVFNRYPSTQEKEHFVLRLAESRDRGKAIEDLMWVLLNSSEFAWNH